MAARTGLGCTISRGIFVALYFMKGENMQDEIDFNRVAKAISFLQRNFRRQPALEEVAAHVHLSPFHFQRLFRAWAGVTPKQFLQYTSADYARSILRNGRSTLFDAAFETGLSSTSRLHDLFVKVEAMTPGEYKNGGEGLTICYSLHHSLFGAVLVASTARGLCYMAFVDSDEESAVEVLRQRYPRAHYRNYRDAVQEQAIRAVAGVLNNSEHIVLHVQGTAFQLKVWEALLKIPMGALASYGDIAAAVGSSNAQRAVGSAVGANPVALLIPCHRVIKAGGDVGEYHWGGERKRIIIGWEAARVHSFTSDTHSTE